MELAAGEKDRRSAALHIRLRGRGTAAADGQETDLRIAAVFNEEGHVIVVRAVVILTHGDDDVHEQVVELVFEILGEQPLELREEHAPAAEGIFGDDVQHLIEQRAALELIHTGLHPGRIVAVVLAGEVALVDPVGKVEQILALRDRNGSHIVNDPVDIRHDLRDRPGIVRQKLAEEGLDKAASNRLEHIGRETVRTAILREIVDRLG